MDSANPHPVDTEDVKATHDKMTAIDSDVKWAVFKFVGGTMKTSLTGKDFETFKAQFTDEVVAFAYYRLDHGVYVFMLWTGEKAPPTDKIAATAMQPFLQSIIKTFAHEMKTSKIDDVNPDNISKLVDNAKGISGGL
ncbi:uncharacterized protein LOC124261069 [Haliotis rubra]|uniref:uncharacterized protein LOC124261069 n=1 Tax=Haliotis rubra TaxID=36100 RepID=UPI001EE5E5B0|nr:uncharacterized protein LOC124261069 [Haliotis rubra]